MSLCDLTCLRDQSSVSLAGKDFQNSGPKQNKKRSNFRLKTSIMKSKVPNINQSESHLTQLNMPEDCFDKTIKSCLIDVLLKASPCKIDKMLMNGGDGALIAY